MMSLNHFTNLIKYSSIIWIISKRNCQVVIHLILLVGMVFHPHNMFNLG